MEIFCHKIIVPQRPAYLVSRTRLNDILGSVADQRLIAVCGPAGYGKTSLLIDVANTLPLPVCWYTLDTFDKDPWEFLTYLVASVEQRFHATLPHTSALLKSANDLSIRQLIKVLVNELYAIGRDFVLILDDWHLVDDVAEIKQVITHLLFYCPYCHLILASRSYLSLPDIMLLTARRQMVSLSEKQLRFTAPETAEALRIGYNATVSESQATLLAEQSNGWITGILLSFQTACLEQAPQTESLLAPLLSPHDDASQPGVAPQAALAAPAGAILGDLGQVHCERHIYRYLAEQVFDKQTEEIQAFLLDTALLEEITYQNCDKIFQRTDSGRLIGYILRLHLFITEIKPGVLCYHSLFREFLLAHYRVTDPPRYRARLLQVAQFYASQGQWLIAFEYYVSEQDYAAAQDMLAEGGESLYTSGRLTKLKQLFALLPAEVLNAPLLCLKAQLCLDLGLLADAHQLACLAEQRAQPADTLLVLLLNAQLERIAGHYESALGLARQVMEASGCLTQRATALRTAAICHHRLGQTDHALQLFHEALALAQECENLHAVARLQRDVGLCYLECGQLEVALDYVSRAEAHWTVIGNPGPRSMCLNTKGGILHRAGRYLEACEILTTALQYSSDAGVTNYQAAILSNLGDLYGHLQLWEHARRAYEQAQTIGGSAYLMGCLDLSRLRLLVWQRQFDAAARGLRQLPEMTRRQFPSEVLLLHAWIACHTAQYQCAQDALAQLLDTPRQTPTALDLMRAWLLRAQWIWLTAPADVTEQIAALQRALTIAEQSGYNGLLISEAIYFRDVLRQAAAEGWSVANEWIARHQDIQIAAQALDTGDQRPVLRVRTLGLDQIMLNGQPIKLGWNKAREVLYYLLAYPEGASSDKLRDAIWPNLTVARGREALRAAIYQLRSVLPREFIALHGRIVYQLSASIVRIDYDVERFQAALADDTQGLEASLEALDLYRGSYLDTVDSTWCTPLRVDLEQRYLHALGLAAAQAETVQRYSDALLLYQRILAIDSLHEVAYGGVMRCQIALGNRAAALHQYYKLRGILDDELGLEPEPSSEAERLYRSLLSI